MSAFIDEHRERFDVEPICRVRGVSASAYYHRARGLRSRRQLEDERLLEVIRVTHKQNYEAYGYRRTWKALLKHQPRDRPETPNWANAACGTVRDDCSLPQSRTSSTLTTTGYDAGHCLFDREGAAHRSASACERG